MIPARCSDCRAFTLVAVVVGFVVLFLAIVLVLTATINSLRLQQ
ncbi:MAG: hypothetical protein RMY64_25630 [Nostoc sp. DedQUE08]|nr:hypothetical protein [Nostoc sp. DedQUE08]MDZ8068976.1 hypothetical protein [Nostoc sp. DedQUE08]